MRYLLGITLLLAGSATARADDGDPTLDTYYGGEQTSAYVIGSVGVAGVATGAVLVSRRDELSRALGWTGIALGGVEVLGSIGYTFQVHRELRDYHAMQASDAARYRAVEEDHLRGVGDRFVGYRAAELALVAGGGAAAAYGFASGHAGWQGVGLGVAALALPLAIIDTLNNRRAHRYLHALERGHDTLSVAPLDRGVALSLGGHF
nr:hypothetical protein [Kofleriaceae bacterium]